MSLYSLLSTDTYSVTQSRLKSVSIWEIAHQYIHSNMAYVFEQIQILCCITETPICKINCSWFQGLVQSQRTMCLFNNLTIITNI